MPGESQQTPASAPDPTVYVQEAIDRASASLRDFLKSELAIRDQRFDDIDRATELRLETINHLPAIVDEKVRHLEELMTVELRSIAQQFRERDTRSERESRDNKTAVDAAFSAQKEAAAKAEESGQKAIDKSERSTAETIKTNQEVGNKVTDALRDQLNDVKTRVDRMESRANGAVEQRTETRSQGAANWGVIAGVIGVALFVLTVAGFVIALATKSPA